MKYKSTPPFYSVYRHCLSVQKEKENIGDDAQASEAKIVQITFSSVITECWLKTLINFIRGHLHLVLNSQHWEWLSMALILFP